MSAGPWHTCENGYCQVADKKCPNGCSGGGYCGFVDFRTEQALLSCPVGSTTCRAECVCEAGVYYGPDCSLKGTDVFEKRNMRATLLNGLKYVTENDEVTSENVLAWIDILEAMVEKTIELSPTIVYW